MKKGIISNCLHCGKEIYVSQCLIGTKKYCSRHCVGKGTRKRHASQIKKCAFCSSKIKIVNNRIKRSKTKKFYCSFSCKGKALKTYGLHYGFKKTRFTDKKYSDYKWVWNGTRMKAEHRVIMENHLDRKLEKWEIVHHINENPKDNRIENLQLMTAQEHGKIHKKKK